MEREDGVVDGVEWMAWRSWFFNMFDFSIKWCPKNISWGQIF
jgi:hypothetical protein